MNDKSTDSVSDPALAALYRQISTESPPPALDERILADASAPTASASNWQPLLAMAASVVIAVLVGRELDLAGPTASSAVEATYDAQANEKVRTDADTPDAFKVGDTASTNAEAGPANINLDAAASRAGTAQALAEQAAERAEREQADGPWHQPASEAAVADDAAADRSSTPALRRAAPSAAVVRQLRETSFADIDDLDCDPETASETVLVRCWQALIDAGRDGDAAALATVARARFPDLELAEDTE
ncbi:MAG: hypothetical protein AAFX44_14340 [Pseudomonadota bacterium]